MAKKSNKIEYLPSFIQELEKIMYYITDILENPKAAETLLSNIDKAIIDRSINPESYEKYRSGKNRKYIWYRIYVEKYIVFYTVIDNNIMEIAHILYNRRDFNKLM